MSKHFDETGFAIAKQNYRIILIGIALLVIGYMLMSGGAAENPNEFHYDEVFSFRRITIAPIVCFLGYVAVLYGIMKNPNSEKSSVKNS